MGLNTDPVFTVILIKQYSFCSSVLLHFTQWFTGFMLSLYLTIYSSTWCWIINILYGLHANEAHHAKKTALRLHMNIFFSCYLIHAIVQQQKKKVERLLKNKTKLVCLVAHWFFKTKSRFSKNGVLAPLNMQWDACCSDVKFHDQTMSKWVLCFHNAQEA